MTRQAGFTMVEVMVAMMVTAIAISGIMALYLTQTRASAYSRHTTEASVLAQDGMEKLRAEPVPTSATVTDLDELGNLGNDGLFTRTSTVGVLTGAYYDLTVTVTWDEDGIARTVTVRSRRNQ